MVAHTTTTYLVTGANRGLGFGLVSALLERPHITVIASCRNLEHPTAEKLPGLSRAYNSRLILVEIDSLSETDPRAALDTLQTFHGIRSIDVLIANAGTGEYYGAAVTTPAEEYRKHFDVNALAPMILFQTFWPLLQKSPSPKFIAISSRLGSIDGLEFWAGLPGNALQTYMPAAPYGGSKAMLNYFMRRLHFEHANLIAFPLSPGCVYYMDNCSRC